ncbi:MAG: hypothetical protein WDN69_08510 [Aliidongia sp.]
MNVGAPGNLTVLGRYRSATLPLSVFLCQTNPSNGQCLAPPSPNVTVSFATNATPTFSIFITASAPIAFAPGTSRVFVRFKDGSGVSHGSTSVAVDAS